MEEYLVKRHVNRSTIGDNLCKSRKFINFVITLFEHILDQHLSS